MQFLCIPKGPKGRGRHPYLTARVQITPPYLTANNNESHLEERERGECHSR
jgi:hypothetical protein